MKALLAKVLKVQKEIKAIAKDQENPFFKSHYYDINSVISALRPILNEAGLVVMQPLSEVNGTPALFTTIADPESGEFLEWTTPLIALSDPQKMGAVITYTRRYALTSLFLLQGEEDDDGNSASGKIEAKYEPMPLDQINQMAPKIHSDSDRVQVCPKCDKRHTGQWPKCIECWRKEKQ